MSTFLESTDVINWDHPSVEAQAKHLGGGHADPLQVIKRCFEWVRDEIKHSRDYRLLPVTCSASEVLEEGSGFCFAKSHLLAALLRANGIPTGMCYQRLSRDDNGEPYTLHGLNAVWLSDLGWHRIDPRGNRAGIDAQFDPPVERLAFPIQLPGESDLPEVWTDPMPVVIDALRAYTNAEDLWQNLPDQQLWTIQSWPVAMADSSKH